MQGEAATSPDATKQQREAEADERERCQRAAADGQPSGGRFRRSVAVEPLYYNEDGSLKRVIMTTEGVQP